MLCLFFLPNVIYDANINITDVTLLTKEEAKALPKDIKNISEWWWLRSPGSIWDNDTRVDINGHPFKFVVKFNDVHGVRPALKISNLESVNLAVGDKFEMAGQNWTVINENTALCDTIVGKTSFRKNYKAHDADDYKASNVKKWLAEWTKEKGIKVKHANKITCIKIEPQKKTFNKKLEDGRY